MSDTPELNFIELWEIRKRRIEQLQGEMAGLTAERDRYRHALKRIARAETEVRGLRPGLYGHAVRIAEEALSNE